MQPDPIGFGDGLNLYAYVGNDPLNFVDPTGLIAREAASNAFNLFNNTVTSPGFVNAATGLADGLSLGIGPLARSALGVEDPDTGSKEYLGGAAIGYATQLALGTGAVTAAVRSAQTASSATGGASQAVINAQKQAGHIRGTAQYANRARQGNPTSTFYGQRSGELATRIANERGVQVLGRPNVKEYDFGFSVGTGPKGGAQTRVRVHSSPKTGEIHGHPAGPELF